MPEIQVYQEGQTIRLHLTCLEICRLICDDHLNVVTVTAEISKCDIRPKGIYYQLKNIIAEFTEDKLTKRIID